MRIGLNSGVPCSIFRDSGGGPTCVAIEAVSRVQSSRFFMLHGHQIIFPDFLAGMLADNMDFLATVYPHSTEGIRKIAVLDEMGRCIKLRRGDSVNVAVDHEVYLDKPYLFATKKIAACTISDVHGISDAPVEEDLRPHTIFRYLDRVYTKQATFRHEYHYEHELAEVERVAALFDERYRE